MSNREDDLVRETRRQGERVSVEESKRMRRASEERLRDATSRLPGGSNNRPDAVPDNLISSGEE